MMSSIVYIWSSGSWLDTVDVTLMLSESSSSAPSMRGFGRNIAAALLVVVVVVGAVFQAR